MLPLILAALVGVEAPGEHVRVDATAPASTSFLVTATASNPPPGWCAALKDAPFRVLVGGVEAERVEVEAVQGQAQQIIYADLDTYRVRGETWADRPDLSGTETSAERRNARKRLFDGLDAFLAAPVPAGSRRVIAVWTGERLLVLPHQDGQKVAAALQAIRDGTYLSAAPVKDPAAFLQRVATVAGKYQQPGMVNRLLIVGADLPPFDHWENPWWRAVDMSTEVQPNDLRGLDWLASVLSGYQVGALDFCDTRNGPGCTRHFDKRGELPFPVQHLGGTTYQGTIREAVEAMATTCVLRFTVTGDKLDGWLKVKGAPRGVDLKHPSRVQP